MLTRGEVTHAYRPKGIEQFFRPGNVRVEVKDGIPQTWAIARPVSAPQPNGAPLYLDFPYRPNQYIFGGTESLKLPQPNLEMDPTNRGTWQRPYRFT